MDEFSIASLGRAFDVKSAVFQRTNLRTVCGNQDICATYGGVLLARQGRFLMYKLQASFRFLCSKVLIWSRSVTTMF